MLVSTIFQFDFDVSIEKNLFPLIQKSVGNMVLYTIFIREKSLEKLNSWE